MTFKQLKEKTYKGGNVELTPQEYAFSLAISKLYSDYETSSMPKEIANANMRKIEKAYNACILEAKKFNDYCSYLGKRVRIKVQTSSCNFESNGTVSAVKVISGNRILCEVVEDKSKCAYLIGTENIMEVLDNGN